MNVFVLQPELASGRPVVEGPRVLFFGEAAAIYRESKSLGNRVPEQVMSVLALHASEHDLDLSWVLQEAEATPLYSE